MYITTNRDRKQNSFRLHCELTSIKTGRIHDRTVADGWAGAVMQKPLVIQKCYLPTNTASSRVACPRLKREHMLQEKGEKNGNS